MVSKDRAFYPLIVLFFLLGLAIGYVIHQPETEIEYINKTVEVPSIVETIAGVTVSPTAATPTPTSTQVPDFEVKIFDPEKDKPTKTIEINNWQAVPNQISIRPGQTVLFKVVNYPQRAPPNFIMGSYERKLGTAGQIVIKFNKIENYDFRVVIPSGSPDINPTEYAKGSIKVY